jgi:hypothetical protein
MFSDVLKYSMVTGYLALIAVFAWLLCFLAKRYLAEVKVFPGSRNAMPTEKRRYGLQGEQYRPRWGIL